MSESTTKKSVFDNPLLSTKVKSAKVKLLPEAGIGYFIGPTLALLSNSILSTYLNKYMTDVLKMEGLYLVLLPLISVIFVILGNIIVGRLMDHMKTKAGKARPLILLSVPLTIIALLFIFIFTPIPVDDGGKFIPNEMSTLIIFAIGYNLWFAVAYPFYFTNHSALINLSTRSSKDRSLLATISNATTLAAMGLTSMILPFFLGMLFVEGGDGVDSIASANHWKIFIIAVMVLSAIGAILEYYFTRERITEESFNAPIGDTTREESENAKKVLPVSRQAKICFKDKYWWFIMAFFFLYQLGGCMKNFSLNYFCQSLFTAAGENPIEIGGQWQGTISIVGAIPTALGMLIVWPLSNKIGKGKAILFGAILAVIGGAIGFIDPTNPALVITSFVIKALGSTPAMYISLALLADILDHQEATKGGRTDSFSMTIYGAIMAGMTGLTNGIINIALTAFGYDAEKFETITNNPNLSTGLTWIFIGGETICYALIAVMFIFMTVEKFSKRDHEAIEADQKLVAEAQGIEYVPAAVRLELEEKEAEANVWAAEQAEYRAKCEKQGLNVEEEMAKFIKAHDEKEAMEAKKKADAELAKKEKEKAKADAMEAKLNAMTSDQRTAYEAAKKAKAEKRKAYEMEVDREFEELRNANEEERKDNLGLLDY